MQQLLSMLSMAYSVSIPYIEVIIKAVAIFVIGLIVAKAVRKLIDKIASKHFDAGMTVFVRQFIYYSLMSFILIAVLSELGVQTASLVAVLGGMSIAVGLSLRSSLSNLASGVLLIMFKPFTIGDQISIDSQTGVISAIQLLFTYLIDSDGNQITVPNNKLITSMVTKYKVTT